MSLTNDEYNSIMEASPAIGEHLDSLGKSDMSTMTYEEWLDFLSCVYERITERNRIRFSGPDGVPF